MNEFARILSVGKEQRQFLVWIGPDDGNKDRFMVHHQISIGDHNYVVAYRIGNLELDTAKTALEIIDDEVASRLIRDMLSVVQKVVN